MGYISKGVDNTLRPPKNIKKEKIVTQPFDECESPPCHIQKIRCGFQEERALHFDDPDPHNNTLIINVDYKNPDKHE